MAHICTHTHTHACTHAWWVGHSVWICQCGRNSVCKLTSSDSQMHVCMCVWANVLSAGGRDRFEYFIYIPELSFSVFRWVQTFLREISLLEKEWLLSCVVEHFVCFLIFFCTCSLLVADLEAAVWLAYLQICKNPLTSVSLVLGKSLGHCNPFLLAYRS